MHRSPGWVALLFLAITATPLLAQDAATEKTLIANERAVIDAFAKGNRATFEKFVARDGFGVAQVPVPRFMVQEQHRSRRN